jgi:hypothetical protein
MATLVYGLELLSWTGENKQIRELQLKIRLVLPLLLEKRVISANFFKLFLHNEDPSVNISRMKKWKPSVLVSHL